MTKPMPMATEPGLESTSALHAPESTFHAFFYVIQVHDALRCQIELASILALQRAGPRATVHVSTVAAISIRQASLAVAYTAPVYERAQSLCTA